MEKQYGVKGYRKNWYEMNKNDMKWRSDRKDDKRRRTQPKKEKKNELVKENKFLKTPNIKYIKLTIY